MCAVWGVGGGGGGGGVWGGGGRVLSAHPPGHDQPLNAPFSSIVLHLVVRLATVTVLIAGSAFSHVNLPPVQYFCSRPLSYCRLDCMSARSGGKHSSRAYRHETCVDGHDYSDVARGRIARLAILADRELSGVYHKRPVFLRLGHAGADRDFEHGEGRARTFTRDLSIPARSPKQVRAWRTEISYSCHWVGDVLHLGT